MEKTITIAVVGTMCAAAAFADYEYEGEWSHDFGTVLSLDVSPYNGHVYVAEYQNSKIQYFTPTGSYIGGWGKVGFNGNGEFCRIGGLECHPSGAVYVTNVCQGPFHWHGVQYFTAAGSFLGQWSDGYAYHVAFGPGGAVYVTYLDHRIGFYTPTGSVLGSWQTAFPDPRGIEISSTDIVYVADCYENCITRYTLSGTLLNRWGKRGTGDGQFLLPLGVAVRNDGAVFVADTDNNRVQYFTPAGSFLGKFGGSGSGPGQFNSPRDVALSADGERVYVADANNDRVQYFRRVETTIIPGSLGKVKALFR
jgi:tripartite motif-containing protein 71